MAGCRSCWHSRGSTTRSSASMVSFSATLLSSASRETMMTATPSICSKVKTRTVIWRRSSSKISTSPPHGRRCREGYGSRAFMALVTENATSPRLGAAMRIPRVNIILHGFYARLYQAPPLSSLSGPLLQFALAQGVDFIPLRGERDEEYQFGATVPIRGWAIAADYLHTAAQNFFDHDVIGNSNIFFPLTIDTAHPRDRGDGELAAPLPPRAGPSRLLPPVREGKGAVTGGLTEFSPPEGYFFLDHDQRNTLSAGFTINLPSRSYVSANVSYGAQAFLTATARIICRAIRRSTFRPAKALARNWQVALQTVNVTNRHFLLDSANTFGGTHFAEPRQIYVELRYRFHY